MSRPDNILYATEIGDVADLLGIDLLPDEPAPYVDPVGDPITDAEFDAIMRDIGVYPQLLTDAQVDEILRMYGWLPDPFAEEPGWHSEVIDLDNKRTWPTREQIYETDIEGLDELHPVEGFLAISYRHGGDDQWTEWQRVGKNRDTWDWMWPDVKRFFQLLRNLRDKRNEYTYRYVRFRWIPYPAGADKATVMHGETNCAISILRERYPRKAAALSKIDTVGGFGEKQMWEASGILKLNMRLLDRLGGVMLETKRDGKWRYNGKTRHGRPVPPVDIYDYDGHALGSKPERPFGLTDDDVVKEKAVGTYHDMKRRYGPNAIIWPAAEGFIVESSPDDRHVIRDEKRYSAIEQRALSLEVEGTVLMTSPFSVEVEAWRKMNGFGATPAALAKVWRAANMYPRAYSALDKTPGPSADINSAYESSPLAGARDLFDAYGFPCAEGQIVVKNPPMEILRETGLVVAILDLDRCHPWVQYQVRSAVGVYTTMRLKVWLEAGAVRIYGLALAVVARKYWPSLDRPSQARFSPLMGERWVPGEKQPSYNQTKHWGREAIGRLVPNGEKHQDYVYVSNDPEAASVIQTLRSMGALVSFSYEKAPRKKPKEDGALLARDVDLAAILEDLSDTKMDTGPAQEEEDEYDGLWRIGFKTEGLPKTSCFHAHAYWLDYSAMVIDREVFRHPWGTIVRIATDSITLSEGESFSGQVEYEHETPGKWKKEKTPELRKYSAPLEREVPDLAEVEKLAGPYWAPICGSEPRMHILEGPPGVGKTYHCLERLAGHKYVVLTPTRKMRKKFVADGHKALTWRWALRPYSAFKPEGVRVPRGSLLYLPEIGTWPRDDVETIIPWLLANGYRLLADGDREQMRPIKADPPWDWLDGAQDVTIEEFGEKDYRSKTEELAALKTQLRGKTNAEIIQTLRKAIGATKYGEFLDEWHPGDYVYTCVNTAKDLLTNALGRLHHEKYPDVPVRIVYGEKDRARSGEEEYIGLGDALPEHAQLAYVTTYTSCQGETAAPDSNGRSPRVWLVDVRASEFFRGALYTGATRVEYKEQLGLVTGLPPLPLTEREKAAHERLYGVDDDDYDGVDDDDYDGA